jgi:hypothetical protein
VPRGEIAVEQTHGNRFDAARQGQQAREIDRFELVAIGPQPTPDLEAESPFHERSRTIGERVI